MRKSPILFAIFLAWLLTPSTALACSCVGYPDDEQRNIAAFNNADIVLQGSAISVDEDDMSLIYTVSVEKVWKGHANAHIEIETANNSAACGINLARHKSTVLFISEYEGRYHTGLCSGTTQSSPELIDWLNNYDETIVIEEAPCEPYFCDNGESHPSCTEDGDPITYIVHPCAFEEEEDDDDEDDDDEEMSVFIDVSEEHANAQAISFVRNEGIVTGYSDGTYRPDQTINRAEFTKIIIAANFNAMTIDTCESDNLFTDVTQHDWFADYVCVGKSNDVISGYGDGFFRPENPVNFAEASKIVINAFGIRTDPADELLSVWWKPYVFALSRIGGLPPSFTDPNQLLTRGEMAEIIFRVMTGM